MFGPDRVRTTSNERERVIITRSLSLPSVLADVPLKYAFYNAETYRSIWLLEVVKRKHQIHSEALKLCVAFGRTEALQLFPHS